MAAPRARTPERRRVWRPVVAALLALSAALTGTACGAAQETPPPVAGGTNGPAPAGLDPPFEMATVDGGRFSSTALAGRPVLLWFWAPWCPTCLRQSRTMREVVAANDGKVAVIGVAGLDTVEAMRGFVTMTKLSQMTHLADVDGLVWKRFGIVEQSLFVMLDRTGAVVYSGRIDDRELAKEMAALARAP